MPRETKSQTVTIASGAAISDAIDLSQYIAGLVLIPGTWTTADLGLKIANATGDTYYPLKDGNNAYSDKVSIDGPVANTWYPLPAWCFAARSIKLWSHDGAGADANQGGARTLTLILKS